MRESVRNGILPDRKIEYRKEKKEKYKKGIDVLI